MDYLIVGIASYLMGSIPFGLILTKVFLNKDIRDIGSGNIGATNALRTGNKFIGYSTLVLDIAKAIIPVIFVKINYPDLIYIASLCAFLGHVFPVWLKFKGGKDKVTTARKGKTKMSKGYARGGIKMGDGGPLKMVEKDGKKVPFFAADGKGKMATGGMATKGGMKGGGMATKGNTKGGAKKKTTGKSKVRGAGIAKRGVRPAKMR